MGTAEIDKPEIDPPEDYREINGNPWMKPREQDYRDNIKIGEDVQNPAGQRIICCDNNLDGEEDDHVDPENCPPGYVFHDSIRTSGTLK
jgi:hypothetical protein